MHFNFNALYKIILMTYIFIKHIFVFIDVTFIGKSKYKSEIFKILINIFTLTFVFVYFTISKIFNNFDNTIIKKN